MLLAKIKLFFNNFSSVINSFFNLAIVQFVELLLPMLLLPYLIRVVGMEIFGLISFATAVNGYFMIFINYGFNLTATRKVALFKNDKTKLNQILTSVACVKIFIGILSACILFFLIYFFFDKNYALYYIIFSSIFFQCLSPQFFLQGIQDLKFYSILNVSVKLISTILVFIILKSKDQYLYYVALLAGANFSVMILAYIYLYKKLGFFLKFRLVTKKDITTNFRDGFYVFLSQVKITFFNNFNIIIVGILLGNKAVGIFSSADKVIKVLSSVQVPVVTALYPHFANEIKKSVSSSFKTINKIAKIGSLLYLLPILFVFFTSKIVAFYLFHTDYYEISILIKIMCIIPVFVFINNLYGTQFLLNLGKNKLFLFVFFLMAVVNCITIYPLTYLFNIRGTAVSVVFTELLLCLGMTYFAHREYKKIA